MALVTVEQVNNALRLDLAADPSEGEADLDRLADVELKILQAEAIVLDYLKRGAGYWDVDTVPGQVSAAVLIVVKALYDNDLAVLAGLSNNDKDSPLVSLLYRSRDPALA